MTYYWSDRHGHFEDDTEEEDMRCPSCNKFTGIDADSEPEVEREPELENGEIQAEVRIVNCCAECGEELTEANFEFSEDLSDRFPSCFDEESGEFLPDHELKLESEHFSRYTDTQGNGRGMRTFYGFLFEADIVCKCGARVEYEYKDTIQASEMEQMY